MQGLLFGALGTAGDFAGSALSAHVPAQVLMTGFAALMLLVATLMIGDLPAARQVPAPRD